MLTKPIIFISFFTFSTSIFADIITVDWTSSHSGIYRTGSFSGTDTNKNDLLEFNELDSFSSFNNTNNNITWLNDFGDFDLVNSTWIANADTKSPSNPAYNPADLSWFSYNSWSLAFRPTMATITSVNVSGYTSSVPLPAAVWLFGSGLIGLIGLARRKKS